MSHGCLGTTICVLHLAVIIVQQWRRRLFENLRVTRFYAGKGQMQKKILRSTFTPLDLSCTFGGRKIEGVL